MGTDIHFYVAHKDDSGYELIMPNRPLGTSIYAQLVENEPDNKRFLERHQKTWYDFRDYRLFSMLANVRNGKGFAGCDTGEPVNPLFRSDQNPAEKDLANHINSFKDEYAGYHDMIQFTLSELTNKINSGYFMESMKLRGMVNEAGYREACLKGYPTSYSGWISGGRIKHVSNDQMARHVGGDRFDDDVDAYTQIEWSRPRAEIANDFLSVVYPALMEINKYDHEDVIIYLGFDS